MNMEVKDELSAGNTNQDTGPSFGEAHETSSIPPVSPRVWPEPEKFEKFAEELNQWKEAAKLEAMDDPEVKKDQVYYDVLENVIEDAAAQTLNYARAQGARTQDYFLRRVQFLRFQRDLALKKESAEASAIVAAAENPATLDVHNETPAVTEEAPAPETPPAKPSEPVEEATPISIVEPEQQHSATEREPSSVIEAVIAHEESSSDPVPSSHLPTLSERVLSGEVALSDLPQAHLDRLTKSGNEEVRSKATTEAIRRLMPHGETSVEQSTSGNSSPQSVVQEEYSPDANTIEERMKRSIENGSFELNLATGPQLEALLRHPDEGIQVRARHELDSRTRRGTTPSDINTQILDAKPEIYEQEVPPVLTPESELNQYSHIPLDTESIFYSLKNGQYIPVERLERFTKKIPENNPEAKALWQNIIDVVNKGEPVPLALFAEFEGKYNHEKSEETTSPVSQEVAASSGAGATEAVEVNPVQKEDIKDTIAENPAPEEVGSSESGFPQTEEGYRNISGEMDRLARLRADAWEKGDTSLYDSINNKIRELSQLRESFFANAAKNPDVQPLLERRAQIKNEIDGISLDDFLTHKRDHEEVSRMTSEWKSLNEQIIHLAYGTKEPILSANEAPIPTEQTTTLNEPTLEVPKAEEKLEPIVEAAPLPPLADVVREAIDDASIPVLTEVVEPAPVPVETPGIATPSPVVRTEEMRRQKGRELFADGTGAEVVPPDMTESANPVASPAIELERQEVESPAVAPVVPEVVTAAAEETNPVHPSDARQAQLDRFKTAWSTLSAEERTVRTKECESRFEIGKEYDITRNDGSVAKGKFEYMTADGVALFSFESPIYSEEYIDVEELLQTKELHQAKELPRKMDRQEELDLFKEKWNALSDEEKTAHTSACAEKYKIGEAVLIRRNDGNVAKGKPVSIGAAGSALFSFDAPTYSEEYIDVEELLALDPSTLRIETKTETVQVPAQTVEVPIEATPEAAVEAPVKEERRPIPWEEVAESDRKAFLGQMEFLFPIGYTYRTEAEGDGAPLPIREIRANGTAYFESADGTIKKEILLQRLLELNLVEAGDDPLDHSEHVHSYEDYDAFPEIGTIVSEQFEQKFGMKEGELINIPEFAALSEGQQLLVQNELNNYAVSQVKTEALKAYRDKYQSLSVPLTQIERKLAQKSGMFGSLARLAVGMAQLRHKETWQKVGMSIMKSKVIAEKEKELAEEILSGAIDQKEYIRELSLQAKEGPDAVIENGKLRLNFLKSEEIAQELTPQEQESVAVFNRAAAEFAALPHRFTERGASKEERERYAAQEKKYRNALDLVLLMLVAKGDEEGALIDVNEIDRRVTFTQLFNTHPEAAEQLADIKDQSVLKKAALDIAQTRGSMMLLGGTIRTAAAAVSSQVLAAGSIFAAAPLAGAATGAYMGARRATTELEERAALAPKGVKDNSQEALNVVDAVMYEKDSATGEDRPRGLVGKLEELIDEIEHTSPDEVSVVDLVRQAPNADGTRGQILAQGALGSTLGTKSELVESGRSLEKNTRAELFDRLLQRISYTQSKLSEGLVNFGNKEEEIRNKSALLRVLARAKALHAIESPESPIPVIDSVTGKEYDQSWRKDKRTTEERLRDILKLREQKISEAQEAYVCKTTKQAATYGAAFSFAGALIADIVHGAYAPGGNVIENTYQHFSGGRSGSEHVVETLVPEHSAPIQETIPSGSHTNNAHLAEEVAQPNPLPAESTIPSQVSSEYSMPHLPRPRPDDLQETVPPTSSSAEPTVPTRTAPVEAVPHTSPQLRAESLARDYLSKDMIDPRTGNTTPLWLEMRRYFAKDVLSLKKNEVDPAMWEKVLEMRKYTTEQGFTPEHNIVPKDNESLEMFFRRAHMERVLHDGERAARISETGNVTLPKSTPVAPSVPVKEAAPAIETPKEEVMPVQPEVAVNTQTPPSAAPEKVVPPPPPPPPASPVSPSPEPAPAAPKVSETIVHEAPPPYAYRHLPPPPPPFSAPTR